MPLGGIELARTDVCVIDFLEPDPLPDAWASALEKQKKADRHLESEWMRDLPEPVIPESGLVLQDLLEKHRAQANALMKHNEELGAVASRRCN